MPARRMARWSNAAGPDMMALPSNRRSAAAPVSAPPLHPPAAGRGLGAGDAYLAVTILIWGCAFPVAKPVLGIMDPWAFSLVRCGLAALLLLAILHASRQPILLPRADILPMAGLGLLGVTYFQGMWSLGLALTTASKAAIIMATSPVWGTVLARLGGERLGLLAWGGVVLSFAGVFLVVNDSLSGVTLGGETLLGDLVFLGNSLAFAVYTAAARPLVARHGAIKTMTWVALFGSAGLVVPGLPAVLAQDWQPFGGVLALNLLYISLLASGIAQATWYAALRRLGLARTVVAMFLTPVVALVVATLALGETVSALQGLGAAAVLIGLWASRQR